MAPASRVVLGEVIGPHGRRGALRIRLEGDDSRHLGKAARVGLGEGPDDPRVREYRVREVGPARAGEARLVLDGVASREGAEALAGFQVLGDPALLEPLPRGEFYWYELIGCAVYDEEGACLGRLRGLFETGAHDVFVVEGEDGTEQLIPAADALLREVNPAEDRIVVAVPEAAAVVAGSADPEAD